MTARFQFLLLAILAGICLNQAMAGEAQKAVPEYAMKAAYLYNFAQLTEWPTKNDTTDTNFNICIYGQNELALPLIALQGKTVNRQQLRFLSVTDVTEARQCQLLYVGEDDAVRGGRLLEALRGTPVLTVTDAPRLARSGAMLLIINEERRLSFVVNIDYSKRSQLKFSSKLLSLARRVNGE
jgi:hypothetical protein